MRPFAALALIACLAPVPAAAAPAGGLELEPRHQVMFGRDGYRSHDSGLYVGLPRGFSLDLAHQQYESDETSKVHTAGVSAAKDFGDRSVGVSCSVTPWSDGFRADSVGVKLASRNGPAEWRTTLGAEVLVTHNTQVVDANAVRHRLDVTQRTGIVSLRQRLRRASASFELSQSSYNKDILVVSSRLAVATLRDPTLAANIGNASGLVQGFPDWGARAGLVYALEELPAPVTLWASYQNVQLLDTYQSPADGVLVLVKGQTVDSTSAGLDVEASEWLTVMAQYKHVRQTNFPRGDYYGFGLAARF